MPDDVQGVPAASPQPDDNAAPSAEDTQGSQKSEQGTPSSTQPVTPVEEARVPLSRLNEVIEQRKQAEARETRLLETLQRTASVQVPPVQAPDFWAGRVDHADPATAQYWQGQKQMFDLAVARGKQEAIAELNPVIQAGMSQLAEIRTQTFRRENPEIAPGSAEEQAIVARMQAGYPLEEAKRIVMYDVLQQKVAQHATTQTQRQVAQRRQASPEAGPGIPATAGGLQAKDSYRETMDAELKAAGL